MEFLGYERLFLTSLNLIIFMVSCTTSAMLAGCPNLKVMDGKQDVTDEVCLNETPLNVTNDCSYNNLMSLLPSDDMRGTSVERPYEFKAFASRRWPGQRFVLEWRSPPSDLTKQSTEFKGFFILIEGTSDTQKRCEIRIITINHSNHNNDLVFRYNSISQNDDNNYKVKIYSLPLPNNEDKFDNRKRYEIVNVFINKQIETSARKWIPDVTLSPNAEEAKLDVYFSLPPIKYGFTQFYVSLIDSKLPFTDKKMKIVTATGSSDPLKVTFTELSKEAYYQIKIEPLDNFASDDDKCLCYDGPVANRECASCTPSKTYVFDLSGSLYGTKIHKPLTRAPVVATVRSDPVTSSLPSSQVNQTSKTTSGILPSVQQSKSETDSTANYIFVVSSLTSMAVVVLIVVIFVKRYRDRKFPCFKKTEVTLSEGKDTNLIVEKPVLHSSPSPLLGPTRKRVIVLYSQDHECHQHMIRSFNVFLQTHCMCDVIELSEAAQNPAGSAAWLADELVRCDNIILFDSMGAHFRLKAFSMDERYRPLKMGPEGDLFNLGLVHIYNNVQSMGSQLILVSVTEEFSKTRLFTPNEYVLPKHMTSFVEKLHNVGSSNNNKVYQSLLPLTQDCLPNFPEWKVILKAIEDVKDFEKKNPNWFSNYFELEKSTIERALPNPSDIESGHGTDEGPRSVTPVFGKRSNSSFEDPDFISYDGESCITVETFPNFSDILDRQTRHCVIKPPAIVPPLDEGFSMALVNINEKNEVNGKNLFLYRNFNQ